jgi:hypothetical protein
VRRCSSILLIDAKAAAPSKEEDVKKTFASIAPRISSSLNPYLLPCVLLPALVFEPTISLIANAISAHAASASDGGVPRVLVLVVNDGNGVADGTCVSGSHYCLVVATFSQKVDEINMTNKGGSNMTNKGGSNETGDNITTGEKKKPDTAPDDPDGWRAMSIRKKKRSDQSQSSSGVCNLHVIAHMYSLSLLEQAGALSLGKKKDKKDKKGKKDKKDKKDKDKKTKKKKAKNQVENYFKLLGYLLVVGVLGKVPIISTAADNPTTPTELASDIPTLRAAAPTLIGCGSSEPSRWTPRT